MNQRKFIRQFKNRFAIFAVLVLSVSTICAEDIVLISAGSSWKQQPVFFPPKVSEKSAKDAGKPTDLASREELLSKRISSGFKTDAPSPDWIKSDFDDGSWNSARGVGFSKGGWGINESANLKYARGTDSSTIEIGFVALRGKFIVKDAKLVKKLALNVTYRGGFVAYLNGKEIARKSLPEGNIEYTTAADDYSLDAFLANKDDKLSSLQWYTHKDSEFTNNWAMRERESGVLEIGGENLVDGVNVLAIALHRTDYPIECASKKYGLGFATIGLAKLFLTADTQVDNVVQANVRPDSLQVWNIDAWDDCYDNSFGNPAQDLNPVKISAAANGKFIGVVCIGSVKDIEHLKVEGSALKSSNGEIGVENISIKFAEKNPTHGSEFSWSSGHHGTRFDMLVETAPSKIVAKPSETIKGDGEKFRNEYGLPITIKPAAVISVWAFVDVPKNTKPGLYKGSLKISSKGEEPVEVALEVNVSDWALPDLKDYTPPYFIYQSPESLAKFYEVDMWSEKHWALVEKSLKLLGEFGNGGLIFPLMAESCQGNPESMVVWLEQADGTYKYDFSIFDRYLKTAMKYHLPERMKVVGMNIWGYEVKVHKGKTNDNGQVTAQNSSGEKRNIKVPLYGTKECEDFWRPVLLSIKEKLKEYNLDDKLTYGAGNDVSPAPDHIAMFNRILPGTPWYRESHFPASQLKSSEEGVETVPVSCTSMVWGGRIPDPQDKRFYGWRHDPKYIRMNFNRPGTQCLVLKGFPGAWNFRMWMESTLACDRNGNGRVGGDFFDFGANLKSMWKDRKVSSEAIGGSGGSLYGTYPDSSVAQTGLGNNTTDLIGPSAEGPVTTARFENARSGNQEAEARVFIERAILDKKLPEDLQAKCQKHLDERTNALRMWALGTSAGSFKWSESNKKLFDLAGEVAKIK